MRVDVADVTEPILPARDTSIIVRYAFSSRALYRLVDAARLLLCHLNTRITIRKTRNQRCSTRTSTDWAFRATPR